MKKKLLSIAFGLTAAIGIAFMLAEKNTFTPDKTGTAGVGNVSLTVYKNSGYTQPIYATCLAQVHIEIDKVNRTGSNKLVWEKTFDQKYLNQYSSAVDALKQKIQISNIHSKSEYLVVKYDIVYNSKGSALTVQNDVEVKNNSANNIAISI